VALVAEIGLIRSITFRRTHKFGLLLFSVAGA
jgi:hypothetical protein